MGEKDFRVSNGNSIKDIDELMDALKAMDDATFYFHVNDEKNDFANWIRDVLDESRLAELLSNAKGRDEMLRILEGKAVEARLEKARKRLAEMQRQKEEQRKAVLEKIKQAKR